MENLIQGEVYLNVDTVLCNGVKEYAKHLASTYTIFKGYNKQVIEDLHIVLKQDTFKLSMYALNQMCKDNNLQFNADHTSGQYGVFQLVDLTGYKEETNLFNILRTETQVQRVSILITNLLVKGLLKNLTIDVIRGEPTFVIEQEQKDNKSTLSNYLLKELIFNYPTLFRKWDDYGKKEETK